MPLDFNALTLKQKKVYSAIESFIKLRGIPPTVREIGEMIGEKTPGAVQGILNRLEQKGAIKRQLGMARSIQLTSEDSQYMKPVYIPEIKKISSRNVNDLLNVYNIKAYHPVSPEIMPSPGNDCFFISNLDSSLLECGNKQIDLVAISKSCLPSSGDFVLAMHENRVFLRRYESDESSESIFLKSNVNSEKEIFNKSEVTIIGKVIGKLTKY